MSTITCGNCKGQHESVDAVKACYAEVGRATAETTAPSDKQLNLIESLLGERDTTGFDPAAITMARKDKRLASTLITHLLGAPRKAQEKAAVVAAPTGTTADAITEGMYRVDGKVYKVQVAVHGSGNLYAKVLVGQSFQYERGAIMRLRPEHKMTLAQAREWGLLYGTCCVCGRTLTDEVSIANGIGPVCAGKGWWGADD